MSICTEIEILGKSSQSWERAAQAAVRAAVESFADRCLIRRTTDIGATANFVAEVIKLEMNIQDGQIDQYRARVKVSLVHTAESTSRLTAEPPAPPPAR